MKKPSLYDSSKKWELYLTRPFSLFGASLWQHWYVSRYVRNIIKTSLPDALFVEEHKNVAQCYWPHEQLELLYKRMHSVVLDEKSCKRHLDIALAINKKAKKFLSVKTVLSFEEAVDFFDQLGIYTALLPYWVILFGKEIKNRKLVTTSERLRSISLYPEILGTVVMPAAYTFARTKNKKIRKEMVELLTYKELWTESYGQLFKRYAARKAGKKFVYQVSRSSEKISFVKSTASIQKTLKGGASNSKKLTGQVAFPGKVTGRARVVLAATPKGITFNKGDVLVSISSNPALMPLILKASALVTDEGGIMTHAAIVSRELHKPCIMGTKHATSVINDGDILTVDAFKGTVVIE